MRADEFVRCGVVLAALSCGGCAPLFEGALRGGEAEARSPYDAARPALSLPPSPYVAPPPGYRVVVLLVPAGASLSINHVPARPQIALGPKPSPYDDDVPALPYKPSPYEDLPRSPYGD